MREPFALNDYAAIWGLKARALHRSGALASLFRVDPAGAFSHPEYPPLWPLLLTLATRARLPYDDLVATPLWPLLALAASLLAVRAARAWNVPLPFALLSGAAVSLLPYWRTYPGYAEGLLLVFVLAAAGEAHRAGENAAATARFSTFLTLAAWTKPEGIVAALAAAAVLALGRRFRAALLVALSALLFAALPWALVVRRLAPEPLADGLRRVRVLGGQGRRGGGDARLGGRAGRGLRARGGGSSRARAPDAPAAPRPPRVGGSRLRGAPRVARLQPVRRRVAREMGVGPHPRRAARRARPGPRRGSRGSRVGRRARRRARTRGSMSRLHHARRLCRRYL